MKLSKTFVLVLILAAFAVVLVGLYSFYSQAISQRDTLVNNQKTNQRTLARIEDEKRSLQLQLTQSEADIEDAESKLEEAERSFPLAVESIEYGEQIAKLAEDSKLNLVSLSARPTTEEKIDGATYLVTRIDVEVSGEVDDILTFVNSVSMGAGFRSTSMQTLEINDMDQPESMAHLYITIYGLKGS